MDTIEVWMEQYGYLTLFVALMLEYIALPFPGELVMGFSGYLAYEGRLNWPLALSLAWAGTSVGMTVTYFIGRKLGYPFLVKIGPRIFLSPKKLEKAAKSFDKNGSKLIFFSFFIPGARHFTGYLAGILNVPFRKFAFIAYGGALFWVTVFIVGGRLFGAQWNLIHETVSRYGGETLLYAAAVALIILSYRRVAHDPTNRLIHVKHESSSLKYHWLLMGALCSAVVMFLASIRVP